MLLARLLHTRSSVDMSFSLHDLQLKLILPGKHARSDGNRSSLPPKSPKALCRRNLKIYNSISRLNHFSTNECVLKSQLCPVADTRMIDVNFLETQRDKTFIVHPSPCTKTRVTGDLLRRFPKPSWGTSRTASEFPPVLETSSSFDLSGIFALFSGKGFSRGRLWGDRYSQGDTEGYSCKW